MKTQLFANMAYQIIIVPYRDRQEHLDKFLSWMQKHLPNMLICIVEQSDLKPFNRAKLLNIGALECPSQYYIMHDVDMLPIDCMYKPSPYAEVMQFTASKIQLKDYLGGVTMFSHPVFYKAGGYNNEYFHRAEDNEMRFNLKRLRIPVLEEHHEFINLPHVRKSQEFVAALWHKAQQKRSQQDQLYSCVYKILAKNNYGNITHLKVAL
jgi:hypothetical protein